MTVTTLPSKAEREQLREAIGGRAREGYLCCVDSAALKRLLAWADAYEDETREAMKFGDTKDARIRLAHVAANLGDSDNETDNEASALLSALLDGHAHHAPTENRCPRCNTPHDTKCVACDAPLEGPARRALKRLVGEIRKDESLVCYFLEASERALIAAEAVLAGGQPAHAGPWALRNACDEYGEELGWWWYEYSPQQRTRRATGHWTPTKRNRHLFTKLGPATESGTARWAQRMHGGIIVRTRPVRDKSTGGG